MDKKQLLTQFEVMTKWVILCCCGEGRAPGQEMIFTEVFLKNLCYSVWTTNSTDNYFSGYTTIPVKYSSLSLSSKCMIYGLFCDRWYWEEVKKRWRWQPHRPEPESSTLASTTLCLRRSLVESRATSVPSTVSHFIPTARATPAVERTATSEYTNLILLILILASTTECSFCGLIQTL